MRPTCQRPHADEIGALDALTTAKNSCAGDQQQQRQHYARMDVPSALKLLKGGGIAKPLARFLQRDETWQRTGKEPAWFAEIQITEEEKAKVIEKANWWMQRARRPDAPVADAAAVASASHTNPII